MQRDHTWQHQDLVWFETSPTFMGSQPVNLYYWKWLETLGSYKMKFSRKKKTALNRNILLPLYVSNTNLTYLWLRTIFIYTPMPKIKFPRKLVMLLKCVKPYSLVNSPLRASFDALSFFCRNQPALRSSVAIDMLICIRVTGDLAFHPLKMSQNTTNQSNEQNCNTKS